MPNSNEHGPEQYYEETNDLRGNQLLRRFWPNSEAPWCAEGLPRCGADRRLSFGPRSPRSGCAVARTRQRRSTVSSIRQIDAGPQAMPRECQRAGRARRVRRFLYGTGLRVHEPAQAVEADVRQRHGRWRLHAVDKGGVEGDVPISEVSMNDYVRYGLLRALAPRPAPSTTTGRNPSFRATRHAP